MNNKGLSRYQLMQKIEFIKVTKLPMDIIDNIFSYMSYQPTGLDRLNKRLLMIDMDKIFNILEENVGEFDSSDILEYIYLANVVPDPYFCAVCKIYHAIYLL